MLLTLTALLIPFAVLPIFLSLERIPRNLLEASADLGASDLQTFRRVILPLSLPGTITAATFVFVLAIGDFLTPQMVGGHNGFTFGRIIYSQFGTAFNWPFGAALSVILAAVVILAIVIGAALRRRGSGNCDDPQPACHERRLAAGDGRSSSSSSTGRSSCPSSPRSSR